MKNIQEWLNQTTKTTSIYYDKYVKAWNDLNCPDYVRKEYGAIAANNSKLRDVLQHMITYNSIYEPDKCSACAHNDINHNAVLQATYRKYQKWIVLPT